MDVRVKIGRRAGEIQDIAPEAARAMLADGRAEPAYPDQRPSRPFEMNGVPVLASSGAVFGMEVAASLAAAADADADADVKKGPKKAARGAR